MNCQNYLHSWYFIRLFRFFLLPLLLILLLKQYPGFASGPPKGQAHGVRTENRSILSDHIHFQFGLDWVSNFWIRIHVHEFLWIWSRFWSLKDRASVLGISSQLLKCWGNIHFCSVLTSYYTILKLVHIMKTTFFIFHLLFLFMKINPFRYDKKWFMLSFYDIFRNLCLKY